MRNVIKQILDPEIPLRDRMFQLLSTIALAEFIVVSVYTVVSGGSFVVCLFAFMHMETSGLVAYIPIVLGTALIGSILVQLLYLPLSKVVKK